MKAVGSGSGKELQMNLRLAALPWGKTPRIESSRLKERYHHGEERADVEECGFESQQAAEQSEVVSSSEVSGSVCPDTSSKQEEVNRCRP